MTGTIVRCTRALPGPRTCATPIKWVPALGWIHAPDVAGETWQQHEHIDQMFHDPQPPDWAPAAPVSGSRGEGLALTGRAIKRRGL